VIFGDLAGQEMGPARPIHRFGKCWLRDARTIKLQCGGAIAGCHSRFVQQATPHIKFGAVSNVLHCSMRVFWSLDAYVMFVYPTWHVECNLVREHDFPHEFVVFVQFRTLPGTQWNFESFSRRWCTVCLCLFIKVLLTSKVVKIIYIHPVLLLN
jgi:hypothetical protein